MTETDFGPETEKIVKIFQGDPWVYSEADTSSVSEDETRSLRSLRRKKKDLATGLPEDPNYSLEQFIHDLDPEMTSTQQSQFSTQQSQFSTQQSQFSETLENTELAENSVYDSMSKTSSTRKKKKKKRAVVGF